MTRPNPDRYVVPAWQQLVCLLLKVTPLIFAHVAQRETDPDTESVSFARWMDLRQVIEHLQENGSAHLAPAFHEKLRRGLVWAHVLEHGKDAHSDADLCPCHTAGLLRQISGLIAERA